MEHVAPNRRSRLIYRRYMEATIYVSSPAFVKICEGSKVQEGVIIISLLSEHLLG